MRVPQASILLWSHIYPPGMVWNQCAPVPHIIGGSGSPSGRGYHCWFWQSWRQQAVPERTPLHLPVWDPGLLRIRQNCSSWSGPPEGALRHLAQGHGSITRSPRKQGTMNPPAMVQIWPGGHSPPLTQPEEGAPSAWAARLQWFSHQWDHSEDDPRSGLGQVGLFRWLSGKESACSVGAAGDVGSVLGLGRSPGGGHSNPFQYSCLDILMDRGALWAAVLGVTKSQTQLKQMSKHTLGQVVFWLGSVWACLRAEERCGTNVRFCGGGGDTATDLCSTWCWPHGEGLHRARLGTQRGPFRKGRPRQGLPGMRPMGSRARTAATFPSRQALGTTPLESRANALTGIHWL